ncbi:MAG TPA: adenylate/guanylate cyclase domain-containing protein [Salinimicrobium sp.]|nr:adenylate/guanylate cyclase domain-containing protein [Salinimicrobium sp.]
MKTNTRYKLNQLAVIFTAWLLIGFFLSVYDHLVLVSENSLGLVEGYSFVKILVRNMFGAFIGALIGGSILVFYVNEKFQEKPYAYTILVVSVSFVLIIAFITLLLGVLIVPGQTGKPLSDPASLAAFKNFVTDSHPIKNGLAWAFVVAVTQLFLQVNSKFGQRNFWNIIRGKYNTPKEEQRIFMSMDIDSSTSIAEKLGDETYHSFLKDFFSDITQPILNNKGNIYQYVGDEVIVSWTYEEGIEALHCIQCFFDIKLHIQNKREKYLKKYGLEPTFKAGMHCGKVVAGEIGIIKRDITYSGDVLNTVSWIQGMCKNFKKELIASADLLKELRLPAGKVGIIGKYIEKPLGRIELRGKNQKMLLKALESLTRE